LEFEFLVDELLAVGCDDWDASAVVRNGFDLLLASWRYSYCILPVVRKKVA
jgi:hypothetical protein